ncbi:MAG: Mu transposase C-terminal domain-containing protein [Pyrinomonadaceae bacterium]|nr:Mu transposase C-terminal domain-containing protein [Pyrinomonadaceae bacterium]
MPNFRIAKGLKLNIEPYGESIVHARLSNGEIQLFRTSNHEFFSISEEKFVAGIIDGVIEVIYDKSSESIQKRQFAFSFIEFAPPALRKEALRRYRYVAEIINKGLQVITEETILPLIKEVAKKIKDANPPSLTSIYRWHKRYIESSNDIRSLVPHVPHRGNRNNKLSKDVLKARAVQQIINEEFDVFYLTTERPSIPELHSRIVVRIEDENQSFSVYEKLTAPSLMTIYRNLKKLDPYFVDLKRYGKRFADQKYKVVKHRERPKRPLEEIQMDHFPTDLLVIDDEVGLPIGRATFSGSIDAATDSLHGFYLSFYPPSYVSVMNCLLPGIKPKTYLKEFFPKVENEWDVYGVPETILVDNGPEFYSRDFEDACLQLGIVIQYHPPRNPNYKGIIERFFRTLNQQLLHNQPGTTFSNIFDRGDYDPKKNAVISLSTLIEIIHVFIVDVYQQQIHRGINDIPARKWNKLTALYPPLLPSRGTALDILLGAIDFRTVSKKGIAWNNLQYNSDELGLIRRKLKKGQKVSLKYNPLNISVIYVADPENDQYITVPALWQEYAAGLTLWQHTVIQRYNRIQLKKDYNFASICRAKELIRQIVREAWLEKGKTGYRRRIAKFINYGGNYLQFLLNPSESNEQQNFFVENSSIQISPSNQSESEINALGEFIEIEDFNEFDYDENDIDTSGWRGDFSLGN